MKVKCKISINIRDIKFRKPIAKKACYSIDHAKIYKRKTKHKIKYEKEE